MERHSRKMKTMKQEGRGTFFQMCFVGTLERQTIAKGLKDSFPLCSPSLSKNLHHSSLAFPLCPPKAKRESSTQWDINSSASYSTYSHVGLSAKNAKETYGEKEKMHD